MATLPSDTRRQLIWARDLIHDCFDEPLSLEVLAREAGLSRHYFGRSFARVFGATPHAYLSGVRLEAARRDLARGRSVTEACLACGYHSLGSFSALFRRRFGLSPVAWQRRVRRLVAVPELWPAVWIPGCFLALCAEGDFGEAGDRAA